MEEEIKKLQDQITALNARLDIVAQEASVYLDRQIDNDSKNIISQIISQRLPTIWWDEIFYISSVFESIDRLLVTSGVSIGSNGLVMDNTLATPTAILGQATNSPVTANRELLMSTTVDFQGGFAYFFIDVVSDGIAQIRIKMDGTDSTVYGICSDGAGSTTIPLGTYSGAVNVLECHYYPGTKVDFFLNDTPVGTITTNLPPVTTQVDRLIGFALEHSDADPGHNTNATVACFSLLQRTKNG